MKNAPIFNRILTAILIWYFVSMLFFGCIYRMWLGPTGFIKDLELPFGGIDSIAVDPHGNIYVTCEFASRVQKYDRNGNFQYAIGLGSSGACEISTDDTGRLYVFLYRPQALMVYDSEGNLLEKIPVETTYHPEDIQLDYGYTPLLVKGLQKDRVLRDTKGIVHEGEPLFPHVESPDIFEIGNTRYVFHPGALRSRVTVSQGGSKPSTLISAALAQYILMLPLPCPNMLVLIFVVMPALLIKGIAKKRARRARRLLRAKESAK